VDALQVKVRVAGEERTAAEEERTAAEEECTAAEESARAVQAEVARLHSQLVDILCCSVMWCNAVCCSILQ